MPNNYIKSSPLDGLQNDLKSSQSIISFESILTNSRLLDKLDLSNNDELLLSEQIDKENNKDIYNNNYSNNNHYQNVNKINNSNNGYPNISSQNNGNKIQQSTQHLSYNNNGNNFVANGQTGNSERMISMPASQFRSLRYNAYPSSNGGMPSNTTTIQKPIGSIFTSNLTSSNPNSGPNSIKNILNDVTFKDKTIQSKVEQHYSNTSRYSYIVEEDTNSIHNKIIENFNQNEINNHLLRRNQNMSTKSNDTGNTQFSNNSLQLSNPLTQTTVESDSSNSPLGQNGSSSSSSNSSPLNDKKPQPKFLKSHKKKNSLTSLKSLFKNNKNKNSSESIKTSTSNETVIEENSNRSQNDRSNDLSPKHHSSNSTNTINLRNKNTSSKLIFSPQPNLHPNPNKNIILPIHNNILNTTINNPMAHQTTNNQDFKNNTCINTNNQRPTNNFGANINSGNKFNSSNKFNNNNYHHHHLNNNNNNNFQTNNHQYSNSGMSNQPLSKTSNVASNFLNKEINKSRSPHHQRSYSDFNTSNIGMSNNSQLVNPLNSFHSSSQNYNQTPNPNKKDDHLTKTNRPFPSHTRNKSLQDDLISSAIDMRKAGNLQASALRLRQACQKGNKTAFLLYGLALRYGYGIERDYIQSFHYIQLATSITFWDKEVFDLNVNPFDLERHLNESIPYKLEEPMVPALYECGIAYLKGFGVSEINEFKGLKCLEKAGAMGHVDSMCLSGIIWSQDQEIGKSVSNSTDPNKENSLRKKDIAKAAAWFRIADKRGANLIGSDWIYKKKYIKLAETR